MEPGQLTPTGAAGQHVRRPKDTKDLFPVQGLVLSASVDTSAGSISRTDSSHVGRRHSTSVHAQSPGTGTQADCRKADAGVTTTNCSPLLLEEHGCHS